MISKYTTITKDRPKKIARGKSRLGFFISPAILPTAIQPSYAYIVARSADPRAVNELSLENVEEFGNNSTVCGFAWNNPKITIAKIGISLQKVATVCTIPPVLPPSKFKQVTDNATAIAIGIL